MTHHADITPLDALRAKGMTSSELLAHARSLRSLHHHGFADVVEDEADRAMTLERLEAHAATLESPVQLELSREGARQVLAELDGLCDATEDYPHLEYFRVLLESHLQDDVAAWERQLNNVGTVRR